MTDSRARRPRVPLWVKLTFVGYAALMLWLLFGQRLDRYPIVGSYAENLQYNIWPLETVIYFLRDLFDPSAEWYLKRNAVTNLLGNVVMFIPLGFFLPCLSARCRRIRTFFTVDALIILGIETIQLVTLLGSFDTDDVLFNIGGGFLGFAVYGLISRRFGRFLGLTSDKS